MWYKMASGLKSVRFFGGFVCGVTVSTGACVAAIKLYLHPEESTQDKGSELAAYTVRLNSVIQLVFIHYL